MSLLRDKANPNGLVNGAVVITGGRNYSGENLGNLLFSLNPDHILVGDCPTGADFIARQYGFGSAKLLTIFAADDNFKIPAWALDGDRIQVVYCSDWRMNGKSAGPIRNRMMMKHAKSLQALVIAAPGGPGTAHAVSEAKKLGLKIRMVER